MEHYSDMLAAVLAAKALADHARPDDPAARAQILRLIEPVERRLGQLNNHQGGLAQFGAGNIAGQAALDMSEAAIRSWRQLLALGAMVRTDELVTRFRVGAEAIQFLTGEQRDAPTLREFNHVSGVVGMGAAAPVLVPPLAVLVVGEAPLLGFAARVSARRVALWAATHPGAALAASEVLLGFGLQIGEGGWESFWAQLHDPQGRWLVVAQVLMDYMHVRGSMGGQEGPASPRRPAPDGAEPTFDVEGARQRLEKARAALQQVHDAAASAAPALHEPATASAEPTVGQIKGSTPTAGDRGGTEATSGDRKPAAGSKHGEDRILGRSFREANARRPPNAVASEAMSKMHIDESTDCSEIAYRLQNAVGSGSILRAEPAVKGTLRAIEHGAVVGDMYYHEAYTDGAYVFDPRMSSTPIPKSDWIKVMTGLNPGIKIR